MAFTGSKPDDPAVKLIFDYEGERSAYDPVLPEPIGIKKAGSAAEL